jgi:hypothetical protein
MERLMMRKEREAEGPGTERIRRRKTPSEIPFNLSLVER